MELTKLSGQELRRLRKDIDKELNARRRGDQKRAKQELKQVAEKYGFSLDDLMGAGGAGRRKSRGPKKAVEFRHPEDAAKTWTGRGRKPNWVKDWEAAGGSIEELRAA